MDKHEPLLKKVESKRERTMTRPGEDFRGPGHKINRHSSRNTPKYKMVHKKMFLPTQKMFLPTQKMFFPTRRTCIQWSRKMWTSCRPRRPIPCTGQSPWARHVRPRSACEKNHSKHNPKSTKAEKNHKIPWNSMEFHGIVVHDVLGLQISVNDAVFVEMLQGEGDLGQVKARGVLEKNLCNPHSPLIARKIATKENTISHSNFLTPSRSYKEKRWQMELLPHNRSQPLTRFDFRTHTKCTNSSPPDKYSKMR